MLSIKNLFRNGPGPSSAYSLHPYRTAKEFKDDCHEATTIKAILYGKFKNYSDENFTAQALKSAISPFVARIILDEKSELPDNVIAIKFQAYGKKKTLIKEETYFFNKLGEESELYNGDGEKERTTEELLNWAYENGRSVWEYAVNFDSPNLEEFIKVKWNMMKKTIEKGLDIEGGLPGSEQQDRRASLFYSRAIKNRDFIQELSKTMSYALAVIEESASGKHVVAAPTAESSGVIPGVLYALMKTYKISDLRIIRGLITAGMIGKLLYKDILEGNVFSDITIATAMASAAATQIMGGTPKQVIAAASISLNTLEQDKTRKPSSHLNYIELNSLAATTALNNATWALLSDKNLSKEVDFFYKTTTEDSYQLI